MNLKTIGLSALAVSVGSFGFTSLIAPSAEAATVKGGLTIVGSANFDSALSFNFPPPSVAQATTISFAGRAAETVTVADGNISSLLSRTVAVNPLTSTRTFAALPSSINDLFTRTFSSASTPFIDFGNVTIDGVNSTLSFFLTPFTTQSAALFGEGFLSPASTPNFTGYFLHNGVQTAALGFINASDILGENSSRITIASVAASTPIPTPALLPGLIGFGLAALRRRKAAEQG